MARVKIGNVRTPIDYLKKFFAPAGHGLGEVLPIFDKAGLDNWTSSGWCIYYDAINPDSTLGSSAFVNCKGSNTSITGAVIQEAYQRDGYGVNILTRVQISGEWQPWEWLNPPMTPGVEYRTTERWNGKPVYTTLIDFDFTVAGKTSRMLPFGGQPIRYSASANGVVSPYHPVSGDGNNFEVYVDGIEITVNVGANAVGKRAYVQLWYWA